MKLLTDFFPLLLFFAAYRIWNIYVATGVAIVASVAQVGWFWSKNRRIEPAHGITLVVILLFGGLTLALRDETFIKWKPTIVNGLFAVVVLGSQVLGRTPAIQRLLGSQMQLPDPVWRKLNLSWGLFFLVMGALNVYVAFIYGSHLDDETRTSHWVNFKVFGMVGLTLVFSLAQVPFLSRHMTPREESADGSTR
jgi:intracellular septation protein